MTRLFLTLIIALGVYSCRADTNTNAIEKFSQEIMHMDRDILTCNQNPTTDQLATYYSKDYMKRVNKICDKKNKRYQYIAIIDLDGASPTFCHEDKSSVAACFKNYVIESIEIHGDRADVKITYGNENEAPVIYYTVLRLSHEKGRWKIDDVSLIDPNRVEGYDESIYSFKAEVDRKIRLVDEQEKTNPTKNRVSN